MSFSVFETDKNGLQKFYEGIIAKNDTYAPVEKFGKFEYKKVTKLSDCDPESPIGTTMSVKPLFFPRSAKVMKYEENREGTAVSEVDEDPLGGQRAILGVKHCDARGLQVLDKVYQWDYIDSDWQKRRANTVIVSSRCDKAGANCFCTSLDYDVENSDAHDVRIVNGLNGKVYVQAVTEKGEAFVKEHTSQQFAVGSQQSIDEIKKHYESFVNSFRLNMNYEEINAKLQKSFDSPEFTEIAKSCISCNTCAFICPTCHCFKITDEKVKDTGLRYKSYDSCNNGYFTLMAGGHNPRPVKYRRWRQRAMHKFVYYKERFGVNLCVGCGHCAIACPVNISIFDVVEQVANREPVDA
jgi:sulfhydrogenase subunit beta (sulfur reductase)